MYFVFVLFFVNSNSMFTVCRTKSWLVRHMIAIKLIDFVVEQGELGNHIFKVFLVGMQLAEFGRYAGPAFGSVRWNVVAWRSAVSICAALVFHVALPSNPNFLDERAARHQSVNGFVTGTRWGNTFDA